LKPVPTGTAEPIARRRLRAAARQSEIVRVALELAATCGVEKTTTQAMADAMGLTQGAVFRHFPTKDSIWLAVMAWVRGELGRIVGEAIAASTDPLDALERVFHAHVGFVARHPGIPRLLFAELEDARDTRLKQLIQQVMGAYEQRIAELVAQAKAHGLAAPGVEEAGAATLFLGMVQGLVMQASVFGSERPMPAQARKVFPLYLAALRNGGIGREGTAAH
jgi:AcrR family transcriptional regulator